MAIRNPQHHQISGIVWSIQGTPYRRRTTIEILLRGPYARILRQHPEIRQAAMTELARVIHANMPHKTGKLKQSLRIVVLRGTSPSVSFGPDPFNRQKLIAEMEGRIYKQRVANPKLARDYGLPANVTSFRPEYIEKSLVTVTKQVVQAARAAERADNQITVFNNRLGRIR